MESALDWDRNTHEVNGHDFPGKEVPKALPYGVYDIANDKGWVNVGVTSDTKEAMDIVRDSGRKRFKNFQISRI